MKQHGLEGGKDEGSPNGGETVFWFSHETKTLKNLWWCDVHFKNGKAVSIEGLGTDNNFFSPQMDPLGG